MYDYWDSYYWVDSPVFVEKEFLYRPDIKKSLEENNLTYVYSEYSRFKSTYRYKSRNNTVYSIPPEINLTDFFLNSGINPLNYISDTLFCFPNVIKTVNKRLIENKITTINVLPDINLSYRNVLNSVEIIN